MRMVKIAAAQMGPIQKAESRQRGAYIKSQAHRAGDQGPL